MASSEKPIKTLCHRPITQISVPNGIIQYDHPFPPTLPSDLRKREPIQDLMKMKGTWVHDGMYDTAHDLEWSQTHPIVKFWSILRQSRFSGDVSALLPEPNNKEEMYVFFGVMTVKINPTSKTCDGNKIIKSPSWIIDQWPSLKAAGFTTVDTVLPNPENQNNAWFFKGEEFVSICWEPGPVNDILLDGPTLITKGWASLKVAGFETVDAFVPNAQFPDQPWVFSGDKYARISISADTVLSGPALLPEDWTSHRQAGFYT